ncbi:glycosyltransferase family 2 protein [Bauldia sp.]|uniref:glycosyltransferase family 2 protein n=1 Tax=Bauldia sp. TaxID=2575872 RepID=UPI003BAD8556
MLNKLIIQIPCLNEAETLPTTLADLPRQVEGFREVEWLVIDDGSTDDTVAVAHQHGVDHVVALGHNQGLARAFMAGLEASLKLGADVIVNTDADNQYAAGSIPDLVRPIIAGEALMVLGARPIATIEHFSPAKKILQRLGSRVVRLASGIDVVDAPSGFRAIHRDAALRLNVFSAYTYTLETLIQAGRKNIPLAVVPIEVNGYLRPSRLVRNIPSYIWRSIITIIRIFVIYKPLRFFGLLALIISVPGFLVILRFLYFFAIGEGGGHIQSLVLAVALLTLGGLLAVSGLIGELIGTNRKILEEVRTRVLRQEVERARIDVGE